MCSRHAATALHLRPVEVSRGDLRMSPHVLCMLVLCLCSCTREMAIDKTKPARWHQSGKGQNIIQNLKRHSDGTFTSDMTRYLDKIKAKDFVDWLASTKREGCHEGLLRLATEV